MESLIKLLVLMTFLCQNLPDPLNKFIEENKTQKEKVIYVGDAISDLKCALRAGVDFAAAGWGIQSNHDFSESTYYFNHPSELRKCLLGL